MSRVFEGGRVLMAAARSGAKSVVASMEKPKNKGIQKALLVSPALRKFIGAPEISRPQATKKIWDHIKANQLQNPANKKEILCDNQLKSIFAGRETVGMLEIARLLKPHFLAK